jgi:hypothetical protein
MIQRKWFSRKSLRHAARRAANVVPMSLRFAKWRAMNVVPSLSYLRRRGDLSAHGAGLLDDLNRWGIAQTSVAEFLDPSLFTEMRDETARLRGDGIGFGAADFRYKSYVESLLSKDHHAREASVFVRFAKQPRIVALANAYFRMRSELKFVDVMVNSRSDAPPKNSQLWHRDGNDHLIFKMYVNLTDIGPRSGAFTYARGTHLKLGRVRAPHSIREAGHANDRSDDLAMETVVPRARWHSATGPIGTVTFADTAGYHKGGYVEEDSARVLYTCMFISPHPVLGY